MLEESFENTRHFISILYFHLNYTKMAVPALRQPKFLKAVSENRKTDKMKDDQHVIISLRNGTKLVLSADAYNGILKMEDMYKCVFCNVGMEAEDVYKEFHVTSDKHIKAMNSFQYVENVADHLMKRLDQDQIYCIICNTVVSAAMVNRHVTSETHNSELQKARMKVSAYQAT